MTAIQSRPRWGWLHESAAGNARREAALMVCWAWGHAGISDTRNNRLRIVFFMFQSLLSGRSRVTRY
jgi:hypothetical protein